MLLRDPLTEVGAAEEALSPFQRGKYQARQALGPEDLNAARALRAQCFAGDQFGQADPIDLRATHILIEESKGGALVCCFRLLTLNGGALSQSYAALSYDLTCLADYPGVMMELGRFCVDPALNDPDVLRIAWAAMTQLVDKRGVEMLFGCASFPGVKAGPYVDAFALLKARHLAPAKWMPAVKAGEVFRFETEVAQTTNVKRANAQIPPLLRTYLMMGGWVSDHAVVDREMQTLHVFTGLEIGAIPPARQRLLRALV